MNLPRGLSAAAADPALTKESAIIVSIDASGEIYVGENLTPKNQLGSEIAESINAVKGAGANPIGLQIDDLPN